jgi:hypothetical protein
MTKRGLTSHLRVIQLTSIAEALDLWKTYKKRRHFDYRQTDVLLIVLQLKIIASAQKRNFQKDVVAQKGTPTDRVDG